MMNNAMKHKGRKKQVAQSNKKTKTMPKTMPKTGARYVEPSSLTVGDIISTVGDGNDVMKNRITGMVGEVNSTSFFLFNNDIHGSGGLIEPKSQGYKYSWEITLGNTEARVVMIKKMKDEKEKVVEEIAEKEVVPDTFEEIRVSKGKDKIMLPVNSDNRSQFVPEANEFKNVNHIFEQISIAINQKIPVLLSGETGTGKTSLVRYLASKTNNGFRRVNHNGGTSVDDIVGKILVNKEGTYWVDGALINAMRNGDWYLADELNASSPEILFVYHSLLDDDGYIVLPENNSEVVRPHPSFRFFATINPSADYHGVKELNKALLSRFLVLKTDFPNPSIESSIIVERTGVEKEVADNMIKFAGDIRGTHAKDKVSFVLSTRDLIMWAQMFNVYKKYLVSGEITVLNKVAPEDFEMVKDLMSVQLKSFDSKKVAK